MKPTRIFTPPKRRSNVTVKQLLWTAIIIFSLHLIAFSLLLWGLWNLEYPTIDYVGRPSAPAESPKDDSRPGDAWVNGQKRW